jgi:hypothetical protein
MSIQTVKALPSIGILSRGHRGKTAVRIAANRAISFVRLALDPMVGHA